MVGTPTAILDPEVTPRLEARTQATEQRDMTVVPDPKPVASSPRPSGRLVA